MTKSAIITTAQLYLDDTSELSDAEFSALFDRKYRDVSTRKPWEGTKAEGTGTTSTSVPYVALAADFRYLTANANHTDSSYEGSRPVIYIGTEYTPYQVVSWSDRRAYREQEGFAYVDYPNLRLYFTKQPTQPKVVEYDYHKIMPDLASGESPWFPEEFQPILFHEMVCDDFIIQQSDKAKSYRNENMQQADKYYRNMCYWNSQLIQL
jgi:hypothetical protein